VDEAVYVHHARFLQDALDDLLDECEAVSSCRTAYPDLRTVLHGVLREARDRSPTVTVRGEQVQFEMGPLSYALRGLLYTQSGTVPARLYEAHSGDWQGLAEYYERRQAWVHGAQGVSAGYHFSVLCAEDVNLVDWDEIERATEGTFMGDHLIGGYKRVCERWPSRPMPAEHFRPVTSERPALILSGERDPVTPASGGAAVAAHWPNSLHVVVPNGGHGQGGPCITAMIVHLVTTGSVEGIDTSCVATAPSTQFELTGG